MAIKVAPPDLRTDFLDAEYWQELARAKKLRLPLWRKRCTMGQMRKWLTKLGLTSDDYYYWWSGTENVTNVRMMDFSKKNPDWPLRAWVGLMLELVEDREKGPVEFALPPINAPQPRKRRTAQT